MQASNLGPRSFDDYSFALQSQPIGFKHLYTHTCTSTQKYLVQTSAKIKQWMMRDSSKAEESSSYAPDHHTSAIIQGWIQRASLVILFFWTSDKTVTTHAP
jgi:hypothetical protein